ncbi:hypothetical protein CRUP_014790 [Coryphaenoides rupestris]|nr:hypothetical protein CRUP_014790 [Coryphaenoides rupestris]
MEVSYCPQARSRVSNYGTITRLVMMVAISRSYARSDTGHWQELSRSPTPACRSFSQNRSGCAFARDQLSLGSSSPSTQRSSFAFPLALDVGFVCYISTACAVIVTLAVSFIHHFLQWHLVYAYYLLLAFLYNTKHRDKRAHQYDAFVSYNANDEHWVLGELQPKLEDEQGWRLCLHHRDFQPEERQQEVVGVDQMPLQEMVDEGDR